MGFDVEVRLYSTESNLCNSFGGAGYVSMSLTTVLEQHDLELSPNCTLVPSKFTGFSCMEKALRRSKARSKVKTVKGTPGKGGNGTDFTINAIVFCNSCTPGTLDIPQVRRGRKGRKGGTAGIENLDLNNDVMDVTINGVDYMTSVKEKGFNGYFCDCVRIPEGTTEAQCSMY